MKVIISKLLLSAAVAQLWYQSAHLYVIDRWFMSQVESGVDGKEYV